MWSTVTISNFSSNVLREHEQYSTLILYVQQKATYIILTLLIHNINVQYTV
jgi:hypothetical protein